MSKGPALPTSKFIHPSLHPQPPGLQNDDLDSADLFRQNANVTNESSDKTKSLLEYLNMFEENKITDLDGYRHTVLSRRGGGTEGGGSNNCLKPKFRIDDENRMHVYFDNMHIAIPSGDGKSVIPASPKFNEKFLDDFDPEKDSLRLTDGPWSAWIVIEGNTPEILVIDGSEEPPTASEVIGDKIIWNIASWTVKDSLDTGKAPSIIEADYYTCPYLPVVEPSSHPFFPHLYQKRKKLDTKSAASSKWFAKVYYGAVIDVMTGQRKEVLKADAKTEFQVMGGQTWYVLIRTDSEGLITTAELTEGEVDTLPFQQQEEGVTSGVGGVYSFKAFTFDEIAGDGGVSKLVPRVFLGSDIIWYRWLHKNVGSGAKCYKRFDNANLKHEFRTFEGRGDIDVFEEGNSIVIEYNASTGSGD
jgi:hypothetical protein